MLHWDTNHKLSKYLLGSVCFDAEWCGISNFAAHFHVVATFIHVDFLYDIIYLISELNFDICMDIYVPECFLILLIPSCWQVYLLHMQTQPLK